MEEGGEPIWADKCTLCGGATRRDVVSLALWTERGLVVVEGVPAYVCNDCQEQTYDDVATTELRGLTSSGFPRSRVTREITVPVFALNLADKEVPE